MERPEETVNEGRWNSEERRLFEEAYLQYGNNWKQIAKVIKTRNSTQVRSHAQKYLLKKKKEIKLKEIISGHKKKPETDLYNGWIFHSVRATQYYNLFLSSLASANNPQPDTEQPQDEKLSDLDPHLE